MIGSLIEPDIKALLEERNWGALREAMSELDAADIADLLGDLPEEIDPILFRLLPRRQAGGVFAHLPAEHQEQLLRSLPGAQVQRLVGEMTPDDQARLLEAMPAEVARRLIETVPPERLAEARNLLGYPPHSAARFMTPQYVALRPEMTAAEALEHVRRVGRGKETVNNLYILESDGRLLEDVRLSSLVTADPGTPVAEIEDRPLTTISAGTDREEVVRIFEKYDRGALPVVDEEGRMLGIITVDDVLDAAEAEATEDIHKMGGMEALPGAYTATPILVMFRRRGVWLSVLFFGQMLTATVMEGFAESLAQALVLASFVPLIISSGGNSGSQATSLIIRALALDEVDLGDWWRVLRREVGCALLLGLWLGFLGLLRVVVWDAMGWQDYTQYSLYVAVTISLTLVGVVLWGSLVGSMLPFLLRRIGLDPATSSAPFVATLVDVTGLLIYFLMALVILRGTLL